MEQENKENKRVFVIGHKNPDTDSICSAIVYSAIRRVRGDNFIAARASEINQETEFVLSYFKAEPPILLEKADGLNLILVDHNEKSQMVDGADQAEILEIIDHHKINFSYHSPIFMHTEPLGSTASLISKLHFEEIKNNSQLAGLLLSAILSDTVVLKSPTTTKEDREIVQKLANIAKMDNWMEFGINLKKINAKIDDLTAEEIISRDLKDFDFNGKKIAIGQIEIIDYQEIKHRKTEILDCLKKIQLNGGYELVLFMATDIIKEGTELLFSDKPEIIKQAFGKEGADNSIYLSGVMSRKKQVVPDLAKVF